jgi:hypothetical protein
MFGELDHWHFANEFDCVEAASLILGLEPRESSDDWPRVRVIVGRMESDYKAGLMQSRPSDPFGYLPPQASALKSVEWEALEMLARGDAGEVALAEWLLDKRANAFDHQRFSRDAIVEWLAHVGGSSVYPFDRAALTAGQVTERDIDPADLPEELQIANIAFRAVLNGYGAPGERFKKRLRAYLEEHYSMLSGEAMERIATVANPDKTPGRVKAELE